MKLRHRFDKTVRYHGRRAMWSLRGLSWRFVDRAAFRHSIIVIGCSRAGTTVIYRTISLASDVGSLNREAHIFWDSLHPLEERGWKDHSLGATEARPEERDEVLRFYYRFLGAKRFVDKTNQNGFRIPYLDVLLDEPYFVFVKRNPGDNIDSLIRGWGRPEEYGLWSKELPAPVRIDCGRYRRWCFFLFDGWQEYLESPIEDVCARQWQVYNDTVLDAKRTIDSGRWIEVEYEQLLHEPVAFFESVYARLGLRFSGDIRSHCEGVVSRPYNAFSAPARDKWLAGTNREKIERVLPGIQDTARALGYHMGYDSRAVVFGAQSS